MIGRKVYPQMMRCAVYRKHIQTGCFRTNMSAARLRTFWEIL